MRFKWIAVLAGVLALAFPTPSMAAMAEVDLGTLTIIDEDGLITECKMTVVTGTTSGGVPKASAKTVCTRDMAKLYNDVTIYRVTAPSGGMGFDTEWCYWCSTVTATAIAGCYGGCPAGWSWKGLYRADTMHLIEMNLGSAVYPPPGAECHWELTQVWCTASTYFIV